MSGLLTRMVDRKKTVLGDFFWMDQNRQYFIFTGRSMEKGRPYTSMWWRQEDSVIGCGMVCLTILGSLFGVGSSCLHHMLVYGRPFSIDLTVTTKYCLLWSIKKKLPNTGFVLFTGLVNNPLISPRFYNSVLDRYSIGKFLHWRFDNINEMESMRS